MQHTSNNLKSPETVLNILNDMTLNIDLIHLILGEKIGSGGSRDVFKFNLQPDKYVVKLERDGAISNANEVLLWHEIEGLKGNLAWVKNWFAPVAWASPDSRVIIMEKTHQKSRVAPKEVPAFFMDAHKGNFGWIGNKFVCHDYGILYGFMSYNKKMQKLNW